MDTLFSASKEKGTVQLVINTQLSSQTLASLMIWGFVSAYGVKESRCWTGLPAVQIFHQLKAFSTPWSKNGTTFLLWSPATSLLNSNMLTIPRLSIRWPVYLIFLALWLGTIVCIQCNDGFLLIYLLFWCNVTKFDHLIFLIWLCQSYCFTYC